jgi:hypothetical protein
MCTCGCACWERRRSSRTDTTAPPTLLRTRVLSLLALLVQKYKYGRRGGALAQTRRRPRRCSALECSQFTRFTGTKVQILTLYTDTTAPPTLLRSRVISVYLLYWHKSTNTDAAHRRYYGAPNAAPLECEGGGAGRQHTSAYVSIRQHTSAYASIRQRTSAYLHRSSARGGCHASLIVSICTFVLGKQVK